MLMSSHEGGVVEDWKGSGIEVTRCPTDGVKISFQIDLLTNKYFEYTKYNELKQILIMMQMFFPQPLYL